MANYVLGESAAQKLSVILRGELGSTSGKHSPGVIDETRYREAWHVEYNAEVGGLVIFLPQGSLADLADPVGSVFVSLCDSLTSAGTDDWYQVGFGGGYSQTNQWSSVWFNIVEEEGERKGVLASQHSSSAEASICIAHIWRKDATANSFRIVKQMQVGTLTVGGSGGGGTVTDNGCWAIDQVESNGTVHFKNCYWRRSGVFHIYSNGSATVNASGYAGSILCLAIGETTLTQDNVTLEWLTELDLKTQSKGLDITYIPLYKFSSTYGVITDFRNCPLDVTWENY